MTLNYVVQTTCDPNTYEDILGSVYTMLDKKIVSGTYTFETDADSLVNYLYGIGLDGQHSDHQAEHQTKVANSTVAINIAPTTIKKLITHSGAMISGYAPRNKNYCNTRTHLFMFQIIRVVQPFINLNIFRF